MRDQAAASLRALYETVERLRAPGGCPWDREQTHRTLRPYLLEETYEALEAIDADDPERLCEELGDLLLQVFMHAVIAAEALEQEGRFDIGDVAERTRRKMVHRHPHVFGEVEVSGPAEVVVNWERLKTAEKRDRLSLLDGVPRSLPALAYALGVQKRPARVGFDAIGDVAAACAAVEAALARVRDLAVPAVPDPRGADWPVDRPAFPKAHDAGAPPGSPAIEDAVGELLFATVALARRVRVNPEDALRRRAQRFAERFRVLERRAREDGVSLHDLDAAEWARRWEETA